ncbi:MAG: glycosyltransferase [Gammaproteobacteria bacterium]|nr:glycosyltransferase [Gammaproteobacteria bacterium]
MTLRVLAVTSHSDLPETHTFIGLHQAGIAIEVISHPEAPHISKLYKAGVPVTELNIKGRYDRHAIKLIRDHLLTQQPHILHVFNNNATSNGLLAAKGINVRIIAYRGIVGNVSFFSPASWTTYLHPRIHKVICVAEAIRHYFLNMSFLGYHLPADKFVTLYKGHDLAWYQIPIADLGEFNLPEDAFVVGSVANMRPRKGIPVLIDSLRYIPRSANVHLLLVGKMEDPSLQKHIKASGQADRIHLAGFRRDAPQMMGACHASVLPALKREGLPKAVIEAMAYATPCIVTDSGGSPELIEHNVSGLVVQSGNARAIAAAIQQLAANRTLAKKMGLAGQQRIAEHFHINTTISKTLVLYQTLVASDSVLK